MSLALPLRKKFLLLLAGGFSFCGLSVRAAERSASPLAWAITADRLETSKEIVRAEGNVRLHNHACRVDAGVVALMFQERMAWASRDVSVQRGSLWVTGGRIGLDWSGNSGKRIRLFDGLGDLPRKPIALSASSPRVPPRENPGLPFPALP